MSANFTKYHKVYILFLLSVILLQYLNSGSRETSSLPPKEDSKNTIKTAKGDVSMDEVEQNVFNHYGYELLNSKSQLIPIVKMKNSPTCGQLAKVADNGLTLNPPTELEPRNDFALNGYANVLYCYLNNTFNNHDKAYMDTITAMWSKQEIDSRVDAASKNDFSKVMAYNESLTVLYAARYHGVKGKIGAVIGSFSPWVETLLLLAGAKHLYTVDYQKITIGHPKVSFIHALDLVKNRELYIDHFEFATSFSSIEHSGLGRYGDPVDPFGDFKEMQKVWCVLKPGGLFFFAVSIGLDTTGFNCHRYYGRIRLAMMFAGFELLNVFGRAEDPHELTLQELTKEFPGQTWGSSYPHIMFVLKKIRH